MVGRVRIEPVIFGSRVGMGRPIGGNRERQATKGSSNPPLVVTCCRGTRKLQPDTPKIASTSHPVSKLIFLMPDHTGMKQLG